MKTKILISRSKFHKGPKSILEVGPHADVAIVKIAYFTCKWQEFSIALQNGKAWFWKHNTVVKAVGWHLPGLLAPPIGGEIYQKSNAKERFGLKFAKHCLNPTPTQWPKH
jgi:hypothetical protein